MRGKDDDGDRHGRGRRGSRGFWDKDEHLPGLVYPMMVATYDPTSDDVSIGLDSGAHVLYFWNQEFSKIQVCLRSCARLSASWE